MTGILFAVVLVLCTMGLTSCRDKTKDSKVTTIFVPYEANRAYFPYPMYKNMRGVMVPVEMDVLPSLYLDVKTKTAEAPAPLVNFFEGAYPVYYTLGHANGHFNGKISVLK